MTGLITFPKNKKGTVKIKKGDRKFFQKNPYLDHNSNIIRITQFIIYFFQICHRKIFHESPTLIPNYITDTWIHYLKRIQRVHIRLPCCCEDTRESHARKRKRGGPGGVLATLLDDRRLNLAVRGSHAGLCTRADNWISSHPRLPLPIVGLFVRSKQGFDEHRRGRNPFHREAEARGVGRRRGNEEEAFASTTDPL